MNEREKNLLLVTMKKMDGLFNGKENLIEEILPDGGKRLSIRDSAHYALGLLARGESGDLERAAHVIDKVLDAQLIAPGEVFDGTFKRSPSDPVPPAGIYDWERTSALMRYYGDVFMERTCNSFLQGMREDGTDEAKVLEMEARLGRAFVKNFPHVWRLYDPNWREFIGTTFALSLELFENRLPAELIRRMDKAMLIAVNGSINRRLANMYPMNTNIELMHIIMCDFYGHRFNDRRIINHASVYASDIYRRYAEFHSVAEFNSPTYNGVDFCALAEWRRFGKLESVRRLGAVLEEGLWEDVALFFNPELNNICGPFSRNYEMDMGLHTNMHALLYAALGDRGRSYPPDNCETPHNILIAVCGVNIPERLQKDFMEFSGERPVVKHFRELIERGHPAFNSPLCTATAWIERDIMLGGLAGSQNVSGQIHPATAYWKADGKVYSMRMLRREPGHEFGKGNRSIRYNASAEKGKLNIRTEINIERDIELFFEFAGEGLVLETMTPGLWKLPGLNILAETENAPVPFFQKTDKGLEAVFLSPYKKGNMERGMTFKLEFTLTGGKVHPAAQK